MSSLSALLATLAAGALILMGLSKLKNRSMGGKGDKTSNNKEPLTTQALFSQGETVVSSSGISQ
ncbi:hypothetical protein [Desulfitobacterium hafniense]|uniref:hypothetical protein n=1 Tax=Desulfitobacterium hafniense TaxID=49338 RepID=UPI00036810D0|nr:hypothetical protein [Desulfitobacterium hafniense]